MRGTFVEMVVPGYAEATSRAARVDRRVQAFLPDPLEGLALSLTGALAADIADAEAALARLQQVATATPGIEAAAWRLLRAEAVASSQIEAVEITHRRLAEAEAGAEGRRHDQAAVTLANVDAMRLAVEDAREGVSARDLRDYHRKLLQTSPRPVDRELAGRYRDRPVWIGGATPLTADYVAPPHDEVPRLVDDLVRFVRERRDLSPVALAAIAHAQFETIHPFHDGNGRVGRCLVHATLRVHGAMEVAVVPVSLALRADIPSYVDGLVAFRHGDVAGWTAQFAVAVTAASEAAVRLAAGLDRLRGEWMDRLRGARASRGQRGPRGGSAVVRLIDELAAFPVLTVAAVAARLGVSKEAANNAVAELEKAGILDQVSVGRRNRVHEALEVFELLAAIEDGIFGPGGGRAGAGSIGRGGVWVPGGPPGLQNR